MTQKAYPIPDPLPDGLRCFLLAIPDNDLFLYQFMGAYRFFGTWVAWERDAAKRGKDAAALWRNAIEWTEEHMNCEFPDYTEILLQIVERLDNLTSVVESGQSEEDMAITINNSNCCGCCGSSSCTGGGYVDDVELDDLDLPDPPDDEPPDDVNLYQKCSVAHYMTMQLRNTLIRLADETQTYPEFSSWWATLWGWLPLSIQLILFGVWVAVRSWLNRGVAWVTANFDPLYDNIVCAMYGAESAAAARIAVNAVLANMPYPLNNAATSIASYLPWSVLFSEEILDLPPGYANRTCCGETPDMPDIVPDVASGYALVAPDVMYQLVTSQYTTSVSIGSSRVVYHGQLTGQSQTWSPTIRAINPHENIPQNYTMIGWALYIRENVAYGGNDPAGNMARIANMVQANYAYAQVDDDAQAVADLDEYFDLIANNNIDHLANRDIGFYRRAGVTASGGPIGPVDISVFFICRVS